MKTCFLALLSLLTVAITPAAAQQTAAEPPSIKIAIGDWPPYMANYLPDYGMASKLISEAFATKGVKVSYLFFPWNRSLEQTRSGISDATGIWFESADRRADFFISKPVINGNYLLYYPKDRPLTCNSVKDLYGHRIGTTLGYFYGDEFERAEKSGEIKVIRAATDQISLKNLALGRIDGFLLDEVVASYMMANDISVAEAEKIGTSSFSIHARPLHLLVSRKIANGEELVRLFDQGLETIRKNGTYDKIVKDPSFKKKK